MPIDELSKEERLKLEEDPLEIWDKILAHAAADTPPEGGDIFRLKFHGLFYVAPNQDSFMVRLRLPAGIVTATQLHGIAEKSNVNRWWLRATSPRAPTCRRANLRRATSKMCVGTVRLQELGLASRGAGADNVRNITASPNSGFGSRTQLLDVRPFARGSAPLHPQPPRPLRPPAQVQHRLRQRRLVDLRRGRYERHRLLRLSREGEIAVDPRPSALDAPLEPGTYFRVQLGGITGHRNFALDTGLLIRPSEWPRSPPRWSACSTTGDRTDRKRARLK